MAAYREGLAAYRRAATTSHNWMEAAREAAVATQEAAEGFQREADSMAASATESPSGLVQLALQMAVSTTQVCADAAREKAAIMLEVVASMERVLAALEQGTRSRPVSAFAFLFFDPFLILCFVNVPTEFDQPLVHEQLRAQIAALQQENQRLIVLLAHLTTSNAPQAPTDESPGMSRLGGFSPSNGLFSFILLSKLMSLQIFSLPHRRGRQRSSFVGRRRPIRGNRPPFC